MLIDTSAVVSRLPSKAAKAAGGRRAPAAGDGIELKGRSMAVLVSDND